MATSRQGSARLQLTAAATAAILAAAGACGNSNGVAEFGDGSGDSGFCPDAECTDALTPSDDGPTGDGTMCGKGGGFCQGQDGGFDAPFETSGQDSGLEGGGAETGGVAPTSVVFVHASRDLPDLRFCWATGKFSASTKDRPFPYAAPAPESNYAAVPVGGAAVLPDATEILGDRFKVWAIDAEVLATYEQNAGAPYSCALALGQGDGGLPASAFWPLLDNPALASHTTTILAVTGCAVGPRDASASACATGGAGPGNLELVEVPLNPVATGGAGVLSIEAAQLSPAVAEALGAGGTASISFGAMGTPPTVASLGAVVGSVFPASSVLLLDAGPAPGYGQVGFGVRGRDLDGGVWMSLEESLVLFDPTQDPAAYYTQPTSYALAVVGDPTEVRAYGPGAPGTPDGTQLHLLVIALPAPQ